MLFNSFQFLLFFPIVTILFFLLPHKYRWFHLLVASCVFYAAFIPIYLLILFFTIVIDYIAGIVIENASGSKRKLFLIISLVSNIGILALFKYYNFFATNINELLHLGNPANKVPLLNFILPIGLSFHTFQAMSYTIEVYRGNHKAERHFGIYSLYVMFYPQLVAGPIERPQNVLYQFYQKKTFQYDNVVNGLKLMMWGLFKKVVIADRLAVYTDQVFNNPHSSTSVDILLAAIFFSIQIFCDFSGYSDIAIGSARVMGFKLMKNFDRPYNSKTISEFWKRWHISLSSWFKDYLYISLGGNRVSIPRVYFNLFFVFLVSGFWHGANWTFIIWGALHGFYLIFGMLTANVRARFTSALGINKLPWLDNTIKLTTNFCLVAVAWIFFRAATVKTAIYMIGEIPRGIADIFNRIIFHRAFRPLHITSHDLIASLGVIVLLECVHLLQRKKSVLSVINGRPLILRWAVYYAVILAMIFFGVFEDRQFIYFQF